MTVLLAVICPQTYLQVPWCFQFIHWMMINVPGGSPEPVYISSQGKVRARCHKNQTSGCLSGSCRDRPFLHSGWS